jgi:tetratricopeptide (TPR) repeat protein
MNRLFQRMNVRKKNRLQHRDDDSNIDYYDDDPKDTTKAADKLIVTAASAAAVVQIRNQHRGAGAKPAAAAVINAAAAAIETTNLAADASVPVHSAESATAAALPSSPPRETIRIAHFPPADNAAGINDDDDAAASEPTRDDVALGVRDGDDDSDGFHRYDNAEDDDDMDGKYAIDYRGHYVVMDSTHDNNSNKNSCYDDSAVVQLALKAAQQALIVGPDHKLPKGRDVIETTDRLDHQGKQYYEQGNVTAAFERFEEALKIKREALQGQYNAFALQIQGGGGPFTHNKNNKEERARILSSMATSINNISYLRQVQGKASPQKTLQSYEMVLQIKREILGPQHLSVGKTLNNIGSVHYLQRNYHEAAASYEASRDILCHNLGHDHLDVCTVTSNLGDVHACMHQYARAVLEYRAALDLRWRLLGRNDPKVVRLMEQIAELEMKVNGGSSPGSGSREGRRRSQEDYEEQLDIEDIDSLRKELQRDMDFFDAMEKDLPIDMVKDKVGVLKDLRGLKSDWGEAGSGSAKKSSGATIGDDVQSSKRSFPPNPTADKNIVTVPSSHVREEAKTFPYVSNSKQKSPDQTMESNAFAVAIPVLSWDSSKSEEQQAHKNDDATGSPPHRAGVTVSETNVDSTDNRHQNNLLTPVERKEALSSVRERLAELRRSRAAHVTIRPPSSTVVVHSDANLPPEVTTPAALLKTSELLTIRQGIDSLRLQGGANPGISTERRQATARLPGAKATAQLPNAVCFL